MEREVLREQDSAHERLNADEIIFGTKFNFLGYFWAEFEAQVCLIEKRREHLFRCIDNHWSIQFNS